MGLIRDEPTERKPVSLCSQADTTLWPFSAQEANHLLIPVSFIFKT